MNKIISLHCVLEVLSFCSNGPCPDQTYMDAKVYHIITISLLIVPGHMICLYQLEASIQVT